MYKFAKINNIEKDIVYGKVAFEKNITKAIVEKDYWVCWFLDLILG